MRISIYQMIAGHETRDLIFRDLSTVSANPNGKIPSELYELVFTGDVQAENMEDIFRIFNIQHPHGYKGRSLTTSDVVEVIEPENSSAFYFCDSFRFVEVSFDKSVCTRRDHNG